MCLKQEFLKFTQSISEHVKTDFKLYRENQQFLLNEVTEDTLLSSDSEVIDKFIGLFLSKQQETVMAIGQYSFSQSDFKKHLVDTGDPSLRTSIVSLIKSCHKITANTVSSDDLTNKYQACIEALNKIFNKRYRLLFRRLVASCTNEVSVVGNTEHFKKALAYFNQINATDINFNEDNWIDCNLLLIKKLRELLKDSIEQCDSEEEFNFIISNFVWHKAVGCGGGNMNNDYIEELQNKLLTHKNIILHGAPGTGKTYLARHIAQQIIDRGTGNDPKNQIGFVQFHPSYDYTDFVEGYRPIADTNGAMSFVLKDGIFKFFVKKAQKDPNNNYVFIIDEINRGEISKIFGELFFSIDPGYRGEKGCIDTQYAHSHEDPNELFYIPDNLYIIGTMNDIDRSAENLDFAMRRRFCFIEITAKRSEQMLNEIKNSELRTLCINKMQSLNNEINGIHGLGSKYQIGAAYFLKIKDIIEKTGDKEKAFDSLWADFLAPLLNEYVSGLSEYEDLMKKLSDAYKQSSI